MSRRWVGAAGCWPQGALGGPSPRGPADPRPPAPHGHLHTSFLSPGLAVGTGAPLVLSWRAGGAARRPTDGRVPVFWLFFFLGTELMTNFSKSYRFQKRKLNHVTPLVRKPVFLLAIFASICFLERPRVMESPLPPLGVPPPRQKCTAMSYNPGTHPGPVTVRL